MAIANVVLGSTLISLSLLSALCLAYFGAVFYRYRNNMVVVKRRGSIVIIQIICAVIILSLGIPLSIFLHFDWHLDPPRNHTIHLVLDILNDLFYGPFYYFLFFLGIERLWLIYYDVQFSKSCLNLEWKKAITSNLAALSEEKWYVQHRDTLGNESYVTKPVIVIGTAISLTVLTLNYLWRLGVVHFAILPWGPINMLIFISLITMIITLRRKLPEFDDSIYLHREFTVLTSCWIPAILGYAPSVIVEMIWGKNLVSSSLEHFAAIFAASVTPFISTVWVVQQIRSSDEINLIRQLS